MQTRLRVSSALCFVATICLLPSLVIAQVASDSAPSEDKWEALLNKPVSMVQDGGLTLSLYVHNLRSMTEGLNVIVDKKAAAYLLPELKFDNVPIRGALKLIERVSDGAISVQIESVAEGNDGNLIIIRDERVRDEAPPVVRVINVKQLIGEIQKEAMLEAFEEGYQLMDSEGAKPELRFHEPSGLLFFKGSKAQVELAMEIVGQMEFGLVRHSQRKNAQFDNIQMPAPNVGSSNDKLKIE